MPDSLRKLYIGLYKSYSTIKSEKAEIENTKTRRIENELEC
jgi:hypothetical protein